MTGAGSLGRVCKGPADSRREHHVSAAKHVELVCCLLDSSNSILILGYALHMIPQRGIALGLRLTTIDLSLQLYEFSPQLFLLFLSLPLRFCPQFLIFLLFFLHLLHFQLSQS